MTTDTTIAAPPETVSICATPDLVKIKPGDTLQFTNDSAKFPRFEVVFEGSSPNDSGLTLSGTTEINVCVEKDGDFEYFIRHHPKSGPPLETRKRSVRSCTGGCP